MSWSEARSARHLVRGWARAAGLALVLAFATAALAGCGGDGFRPMYGTTAFGTGLKQRMSSIAYAPIPGRVGQRVRNELIFLSGGGAGEAVQPEFKVEIVLKESLSTTLVSISGDSAGQVVNLDAAFRIIRLKDRKVIFQSRAHARASFERFKPIFANIRALEDAQNRAAQGLATEINGRLAAFLSRAA